MMKMMSCKDVHELVSSEAQAEAGLRRRIGLRLHLFMCKHCRAYVGQIRAIGDGARKLFREGPWDRDALDRLQADILRRAAGPPTSPTGEAGLPGGAGKSS